MHLICLYEVHPTCWKPSSTSDEGFQSLVKEPHAELLHLLGVRATKGAPTVRVVVEDDPESSSCVKGLDRPSVQVVPLVDLFRGQRVGWGGVTRPLRLEVVAEYVRHHFVEWTTKEGGLLGLVGARAHRQDRVDAGHAFRRNLSGRGKIPRPLGPGPTGGGHGDLHLLRGCRYWIDSKVDPVATPVLQGFHPCRKTSQNAGGGFPPASMTDEPILHPPLI